jgi:hypothetical protein
LWEYLKDEDCSKRDLEEELRSSILWLDLEFRLPSCDPHPRIGLKEKARIKRMPRKCRVHDRKLEISKELDTSDGPRKKSLL